MPTLTPQEIARLQAEKAQAENVRDTMNASVPAKQARAAELAVADGAFKKFFDYYNRGIIYNYDLERQKLNGQYIANPIVEADIQGPASLDGGARTTPTAPATDIVRVAEFDGGPLVVDADNEVQHISDQAAVETALVSGYASGAVFNPATAKTNSALTPASTTLNITDPTNALTFSINDIFVVVGISEIAVVKVTSVTTPPGATPPFNKNLGVELLVPPSGTIVTNSSIANFTGFTNTERTNKVTTNPQLQPLMDYLIDQLEEKINARITNLYDEKTPLQDNEDPDAVSALTAALADVQTSINFLENYLLTTIISNTGLATLSTERGVRGGQITARVAAIVAAFTGQTENYFDARYTMANNRANVSRGTLRLQYATESAATTLTAYADGAQDTIDAINALLP